MSYIVHFFLSSYPPSLFTQNLVRWMSLLHPQSSIAKSNRSSITHHECLDFFDHLLQQSSTIQQCKQIHTQIVVAGSYQSAYLAARLLSVYGRFGLLVDAQKVFDSSQEECFSNLLLWNSILRAHMSIGNCGEVLKLYRSMRNLGVRPDGFTFPLVIRACALMGCYYLCLNVHCHVLQMGFQYHLHVVNELLGMYGKLGHMENACWLFDRMGVRNYISWNTMVSAFTLNYDCDGAIDMFQRMESEGLEPNLVTWTSLLSSYARCRSREETLILFDMMRMRGIGATAEVLAVVLSVCANSAAFDKGKVIHGYITKGGFEDYLFLKNALICVYGKHGSVDDARNLFMGMGTKNIVSWNALITSYAESGLCDEAFELFSKLGKFDGFSSVRPNLISWSAVIGGFASNGQGNKALNLFREMQLTKVIANSITISSILSVCAELATLNFGKEIHGHAVRVLIDCNNLVGNGLVNMYVKCGCLKEANLTFDKINHKDLISWNSMITGYGTHGFGEIALRKFDQMIKDGFQPDGVSFVAVLSACSHTGLVADGRRLFDQMINEYRIEPQMEHFACMVDLLGRAGFLQEASNLVKNMPMEPNACVWGALLNSCRMHRNTEVAEEIASQIFRVNSEMTGSYMLLSNIYAATGRWEDSARVRISAKTMGFRKIPGQSWIEVKKKFYMFSAGTIVERGLEEVYGILMGLALQMESEGYIPKIFLQDADEEQKRYYNKKHCMPVVHTSPLFVA